ncbi:Na+/H+ antiporter NhaA [Sphingorhabdus lacus]|uniref:Na+/H+ antiporter NhaA n=1 Tax=Sphingorhabdus lacus TaxID=392610 RepID=UPI0035930AAC
MIAKRPSALRQFIKSEASGGIVLMAVAALALVMANSPMGDTYASLKSLSSGLVLSDKLGPMTVKLWINDGLMAIFFLLVGLEVKREFSDGRLASWQDRRLPMIAAMAGLALPAMIYLLIAGGDPTLIQGWAIPAATDIAFAVGVLALLGSRAPPAIKLLLVTIAIIDDIAAVSIIALFYTAKLNLGALVSMGLLLALGASLNYAGVKRLWIYLLLGVALWLATLMSGIHATIAGVLLAMIIPFNRSKGRPDAVTSPLHILENALHKPVAFAIVPLFGFVNAGVAFNDLNGLATPLGLAIALGLFLGKQLGIFSAVYLAVRLRLCPKPAATWTQIYGMSVLCGIGFTMSLFIGDLAFSDAANLNIVKQAVLAGSVASAIVGYIVLVWADNSRSGIDG